jgi:hypothetical protein
VLRRPRLGFVHQLREKNEAALIAESKQLCRRLAADEVVLIVNGSGIERFGRSRVADLAERLRGRTTKEPIARLETANERGYGSPVAELSQVLGGVDPGHPLRVG